MVNSFLKIVGITVLLVVQVCIGDARAEEKVTDKKHVIQFPLEYMWRKLYQTRPGIKAMAIADNGAFGISYNESFPASAEARAMEKCVEQNKFRSLRVQQTSECRLLTVQSDWKIADLQADPDWQKPLEGRDVPMRKGRKYLVNGKSKGIILHVHGCDGTGAKIFSDVWAAYFNALGYDLYVPDSFAVKRPKHVCGYSTEHPPERVSDVWRLRVAQTQRTLADVRKANPGKPVFLWGHSEGGLIVQMVEADVAGIIVSGEECGALQAPPAAPASVPFLYIWGEYDQYVNGLGLFKVDEAATVHCRAVMPDYTLSHVILEGRGHNPFPWNKKINAAIANFLKGEPMEVSSQPRSSKMAKFWKQTKPGKAYRKAQGHRAAAINATGKSYLVWGLDNEEDARQLALFGCASSTARKTNLFKTGKHLCAVVDVNGIAPK
jgi:pimeloyl-ACP methyl ester carboxylesterase